MKKSILYTVLLSLSSPFTVYAIGLGDIAVHSYLNQPFDAEIELIDVGNIPLSGIKANLALPEEFERLGMERNYVLDYLIFTIDKSLTGKPVIKVRSIDRIDEPYMQVLVDLAWANGQVDRAYTVLLDPPDYQLVTIKKQKTHRVVSKPLPSLLPNQSSVAEVPVSSKLVMEHHGELTYGPTISNETVWQIAQRYQTPGVILQQVILAIVGINPDAFVDGNLNGLRPGSTLKIPDNTMIASIPAEQAKEEVMAHDTAWRAKQNIQHVFLPPYTDKKGILLSQLPSVPILTKSISVNDSQTPSLPSLLPKLSSLQDVDEDKAPNATLVKNTDQQIMVKQMKAEIDIATTAIDSVRETNTVLNEQLRLLQNINERQQQELSQRDQEILKLQQQVLTLTKRQSLAGQASPVTPVDDANSKWPWLLFLLLIAGGGLFAYWRLWSPAKEGQKDGAETTTEIEMAMPQQPVTEDVYEAVQEQPNIEPEPEPEHQETPLTEDIIEIIPETEEQAPSISPKPQKTVVIEKNVEENVELIKFEPMPEELDDHILEFELGEEQEIPPVKKKKSKPVIEEKDEHGIDFVPVSMEEPTPEGVTPKPARSKRALATLLDLAKTYLSMGDIESARQSLQEVLEHGDKTQQKEAKELLEQLGKE